MKMYDNQFIALTGTDFSADLTGTLINGDERVGTKMEGEAICSGANFDKLSFISLSQEIVSVSVPVELDFTICGVTGTITATVE